MGVQDGSDGLIGDRVLFGHDLGELIESRVELGAEIFVLFSQGGDLLFHPQ